MHLTEIAKQANADPQKLGTLLLLRTICLETLIPLSPIAPVLRLLSAQWVFKEVKPDVFANNRLSSVLDKGKTVAELQQRCADA